LEVYLSTRRGAWVTNRISANGLPGDYVYFRRFSNMILHLIPRQLRNSLWEHRLNARFDHSLYGLKPRHRVDAQHPMVNDRLPNVIASGTVVIKPNVQRITETAVEFDDGSVVNDVDVIIYATGYVFGFPFIDHPELAVTDNQVNLYKYVFPPNVRPSTIAVIGCIQPIGAIWPISELQCRWAVRVFKVCVSVCIEFNVACDGYKHNKRR
jgi:dimethylaniline monooxygenase (N-oxide forming)